MNMKQLLEQFLGQDTQGLAEKMSRISEAADTKATEAGIPGGLAGGLAAGGILSLLLSSQQARKYAGTAAKFGGVALLGGAAYQLYQNWQKNNDQPVSEAPLPNTLPSDASDDYHMTLIKAMIAAAKADGHINGEEQAKIFETVDSLGLAAEEKGVIFDLLNTPISVDDIAQGLDNDEQKTEVYLASCLIARADHPEERKHLDQLAQILALPEDLKQSIETQVARSA